MENEQVVLSIAPSTKYWFVRAGSQADYYYDFFLNNYIAIGDNAVSLDDLYKIDPIQTVDEKLFKIQYNEIYKRQLTDEFLNNPDSDNLDTETKKAELIKISQSAGKSATKGFNFVEKMKSGDIVLVPSKGSSKFLIGVVTSEPFDAEVSHIDVDQSIEYKISKFIKKRRILWLKEITISELPDKLLWIKNGHQTIFDITKNANEINPILSNKYIYKGQYYERIGVSSPNKISEDDFFNLQTAVHNTTQVNSNSNIYQTISIQSPGEEILHTVIDNWPAISIAVAALFGKINLDTPIGSVRIQGLVPYFSKQSRLERKIAVKRLNNEDKYADRQAEIKIETAEEKLEQERIATKKAQLELNTEQNLRNIESTSVKTSRTTPNSQDVAINSEQQETLERIKANQNPVGSVISFETQMDTVIQTEDEHPTQGEQK